MRRWLAIALVALFTQLLVMPSAVAAEDVCWKEFIGDGIGGGEWVTVCRVNGVIVIEGTPGWTPPSGPLTYDLGYDTVGECYYQRTGPWSGWIVLGSNGQQLLFAYDPDGVPGGPWVGDAWVDPCISEPIPGTPPRTIVVQVVSTYQFEDPAPDLVPDGIGLAGAETQIHVDPPAPFSETLTTPIGGGVIDIQIKVAAVTIAWGDGTEVTIPESQFDLFAPYPDGNVRHVWEEKDYYTMEAHYQWSVRWRVNGGAWNTIDMPDTFWSEPYQVDEVVGRRSG